MKVHSKRGGGEGGILNSSSLLKKLKVTRKILSELQNKRKNEKENKKNNFLFKVGWNLNSVKKTELDYM